ncbi:YraN family protein [Microscilla marina]|uniref:UPF0102 protein M23134_07546 n=1 Tax=Microscilla marina ATCC 23134 TaxID=313606 RepID=A1ZF36_MICM2|nr:YraN family protein [Microscilla marina]EAY31138.1 conserved hypothetical protein [Microscilla marina ATCC 23134]
MKTPQQKKGKYGENLAAAFMQNKGYTLLERNYRYKRGEIDIIAQTGDVLVFVEVKLRSSDNFGLPEESVSENQQNLIIQTAEQYIEEIDWESDIRFDIVAIELKSHQSPQITYFEDAFY